MKRLGHLLFGALAVLCLGALNAPADERHSPPRPAAKRNAATGPHGGVMKAVDDLQYEIVFTAKCMQLHVYDKKGEPVVLPNIRGRVSITKQGDPRTHRFDLYPHTDKGRSKGLLYLAIDLSQMRERKTDVELTVYGLAARPVRLTTPLRFALTAEQIAIRNQRICPVSGKRLSTKRKSPKVAIGDQVIYVCCAACEQPLRAKSSEYLQKLGKK